MSDIFDEINEDLRKDRAQEAWRKYGKYAIGAAVAIVLATAANTGWKWYQEDQQSARALLFASSVSQARSGEQDAAATGFARLADEGGEGFSTLSRLRAAALKVEQGDREGAVLAYDTMAADEGLDDLYRRLATVLSVMHQVDVTSADGLIERLAPELDERAPWRFTALEVAAAIELKRGNTDEARSYLTRITDAQDAPSGARGRAAELLQALGS